MCSCVCESFYFALVHQPNIYHLSSRLQFAAEKSKTAKQNSQKHGVFQKTGFGMTFRTAESSHAFCWKLELLWRKLKASAPCDTNGELNLACKFLVPTTDLAVPLYSFLNIIAPPPLVRSLLHERRSPVTAENILSSTVYSRLCTHAASYGKYRGQSGQDEKVTTHSHTF